jgi:RNA 3'-terminal phosphate cyclase (ATP)
MIEIDGSFGEGGGQIVRTSIGLSLSTGQPVRVKNVRARRKNPGLQKQHLTALNAAAAVSNASVSGATLRSTELEFSPGQVQPGNYNFSVGTAGSTTLILQTVLPALMIADAPSEIHFEGGTHNPLAPPVDFLQKTFLPIISQMGPRVELRFEQFGFYPAGGGRWSVKIEPTKNGLKQNDFLERGALMNLRSKILIAQLPEHIAMRELTMLVQAGIGKEHFEITRVDESNGPGNVVMIESISEKITEVFTGFGEKGVAAESVAEHAIREWKRYSNGNVFAGEHLADQLLLPMALAKGGSFSTLPLSGHAITNMDTIRHFLDVDFKIEKAEDRVLVQVN